MSQRYASAASGKAAPSPAFLLLALLALAALLPRAARAQPEEILTSKRVARKVTLGFHPSELANPSWEMRYSIDEDFEWKDSKRFKSVVALSATDEFNILTTFVNPLAYRVRISETSKEDPASKATEEFLQKLVQLFPQAVTNQSNQPNVGSISAPQSLAAAQMLNSINSSSLNPDQKQRLTAAYLEANATANGVVAKRQNLSEIRSPELLNLLLWVETRNAADELSIFPCLKPGAKQAEALRAACARVERQFYSFPEQVNTTVSVMKAPITFKELEKAMPTIEEHTKQLKATLDSTQYYLDRLQFIGENGLALGDSIVDKNGLLRGTAATYAAGGANPNWQKKKSERTVCGLLQDYIRYTISTYVLGAKEKQKVRQELYASLLPLLATLRQATLAEGYNNRDDKRFLHQGTIDSEQGIIKDVDISLHKVNLTLTDNAVSMQEEVIFTGKFRVRRYSLIVAEIGTGSLVSNLLYPRFGTSFNSALNANVVADAGADRVNAVPTAMLNTFLMRGPAPFLPVLQLGIGAGRDARPTLFTGIGLRFLKPNHLAFSLGSLWNFQQQLDQLRIGQAVSGEAAVKEDISYTITDRPKFAVGLQYSF